MVQAGERLNWQEEHFGISVGVNTDGKLVAVGGPQSGLGDQHVGNGVVRVYEFVGDDWNQVGLDIQGEKEKGDRYRDSVSLSGDGKAVAVGSPDDSDNGDNSGHVSSI